MREWIVVFIVMLPIVAASQEAEDLFASERVGIDLTVSSHFDLKPKQGNTFDADYVQTDLFFFPKEDTAQRVQALTTTPEAQRTPYLLRYRWEKPKESRLNYAVQSKVEVRNVFPRVTQKIPFPIQTIPSEARPYLDSSEHIDSTNTAILNLANQLAQGKDDLFVVVSDIAIWVKNNIEYNLSTLTADVSQKASWVLQNKYGVCDELTSLFIALLRALGIPARFVTGVSYTSSPLFPQRWGAHGWAEVYFPEIGWIPFDPTFGEFGWIDPGHIKMMISIDPEEPSTRFEWKGTNSALEAHEPSIDANIVTVGERLPQIVGLSVQPLYGDVGFGSYNLVQATVENLQEYYITTEIQLARVKELEALEPYNQQVILRPHEKKTVVWRIFVVPQLNQKYVYSIPVGVYTVRNESVVQIFTARAQGSQHTKVEVTRAMNALIEEEKSTISENIELQCTSDRTTLYPKDIATIKCNIRNLGTNALKQVHVCLEEKQCGVLDLGIGQQRELSFVQGFTIPGSNTVFVRAINADVSKTTPVTIVMQDIPAINITELTYPPSIAYGSKFTLSILLKPVSYNTPQNVHVEVRAPARTYTFDMPELIGEQVIDAEMQANDLSLGATEVQIDVSYQDDQGKTYHTTQTAPITLTDVPFFAKIKLWLRGWFE